MDRRDLLRTFGAVTALSFLPRDAESESAWPRIVAGERASNGLTHAQLRLVGAMSDAIIPRTDSPGATDVAVPAWVDLIVSEYYNDSERIPFVNGLDAIDIQAIRNEGTLFAELTKVAKDRVMDTLDRPADRTTLEARAYSRLKGLVIHGYFTSREVQQKVLKTVIMPGRFDGAAPMQITRRPS